MKQMKLASAKGTPPMRPLFFDFPDDDDCNAMDDQFMFGPDLLVAPVLHSGRDEAGKFICRPARHGRMRGPAKQFKGGRTIIAAAPLDKIPLLPS